MQIYLIRHTTPLIKKGVCYGQSDLDVTDSFLTEAELIREHVPENIINVYTSPLQRCSKLAAQLFPDKQLHTEPDLMEINCGSWELQHWDAIPSHEIDPWMNDFVNVPIPGGENYVKVFHRTVACFRKIAATGTSSAIVTHGGVIRSILSHLTNTALIDSFQAFRLHYGCVIRIDAGGEPLRHFVLHNPEGGKEQHKPSSYYKSV